MKNFVCMMASYLTLFSFSSLAQDDLHRVFCVSVNPELNVEVFINLDKDNDGINTIMRDNDGVPIPLIQMINFEDSMPTTRRAGITFLHVGAFDDPYYLSISFMSRRTQTMENWKVLSGLGVFTWKGTEIYLNCHAS